MNRLQDKVAIVYGAGPNIGGTTAYFLAREGAKVVVNDINALALNNFNIAGTLGVTTSGAITGPGALVVGGGRRDPTAPDLPAERLPRLKDYVGRGVVTTSTYEARTFGVFSVLFLLFIRFLPVMPMAELKAVTPQADVHGGHGHAEAKH